MQDHFRIDFDEAQAMEWQAVIVWTLDVTLALPRLLTHSLYSRAYKSGH